MQAETGVNNSTQDALGPSRFGPALKTRHQNPGYWSTFSAKVEYAADTVGQCPPYGASLNGYNDVTLGSGQACTANGAPGMVKWVHVIGVVAVSFAGSCGGAPGSAQSSRPSTPAAAAPRPTPPGGCEFSDDVADLDGVRAQSDVVVRGTVRKPPVVHGEGAQSTTYFEVAVGETIESRGRVASRLHISVAGPPSPLMFPDSEYVMFLFSLFPDGGSDRNVGAGTFEPTNGLYGLFPVRDGLVYRECSDPTAPRRVAATGAGQGQRVDEFVAKLRARPRPTPVVVPKPTGS